MASVQITDYALGFHIDSQGKTVFDRADISLKAEGLDPSQKVTVHLYQGISQSVNSQILYFPMLQVPSGTGSFGLGDAVRSTDLDMDSNYIKLHVSGYPAATLDVTGAHSLQKGKSYTATKAGGFKESTVSNPTTHTNMNRKSLFQSAVSAVLQFGRDGSFIKWDSGKFIFTDRSGTEQNVAVAAAKADEDAVNLGQLKEKLAELAKKGGMTVADLDTSSNPWGDNEVRVTTGLKFKRKTPTGTEDFTPADGTVFSVAKELTIAAGHIANGTGSVLKADHIFIYDAPTGKAYDNGAIGEAYNEKGVAKKMAIDIDSSGSGAGMDVIPKDSRITGCTVYVNGAFDGVPNNLQLKLGSDVLLDFGSLDLTEPALIPVDLYSKLSADSTPAISGSLTGGSKGEAVVFLEYVAA